MSRAPRECVVFLRLILGVTLLGGVSSLARADWPARSADPRVRVIALADADVFANAADPDVASDPSEVPPQRSPAGWAEKAEEAGRRGSVGPALGMWQEAWDLEKNVAFRLWVESRVKALTEPLTEPRLLVESSGLAQGSRLRALVELRRAALLLAAGREDQARAVLDAITAGLEPEERRALQIRSGLPETYGAHLPLTGPLGPMGREILGGMVLAAGLVGRSIGNAATVLVRDSERGSASGIRHLARRGALAIIGLPESRRARQATPACQAEEVICLTAADGHGVPELGSFVFRGVHAPTQRARALAAWLAHEQKGARVALVHPDSAYGKRTAGAFEAEARRLGLTIVDRVLYPHSETNLYPRFQPLVARAPDAIFVADTALRLEIVAPQLALAGLGPVPSRAEPRHARRGQRPKTVLLLSTAEGLGDRLVRNVGHSVEGALVAPGFYPDPQDPSVAAFVTAYQQAYGRPPGRYAAFGYLWMLELRSLFVSRAHGRLSLHRALTPLGVQGRPALFDAARERSDPPRLYRVTQGVITRVATPAASASPPTSREPRVSSSLSFTALMSTPFAPGRPAPGRSEAHGGRVFP